MKYFITHLTKKFVLLQEDPIQWPLLTHLKYRFHHTNDEEISLEYAFNHTCAEKLSFSHKIFLGQPKEGPQVQNLPDRGKVERHIFKGEDIGLEDLKK